MNRGLADTGTSTAQDRSAAHETLALAREHLLARQHPDGHWRAVLQTNVTMDAEDILLRQFLGIAEPTGLRASAAWIRSQQDADGSWANFAGAEGDLSSTIEAYWALRVAGDLPSEEHMSRAAVWVRERGGPRKARVFTHIWMAAFGLWSWHDVPALPPEIMFLPSWFPLNVYDFACWARQTIVALTIVRAHRPVRPLPFTLDELGPGAPADRPPARSWTGRALTALDAGLRVYERHAPRPIRTAALRVAESWVVQRQEADGGWGGIQPPWVYSLMALHLQGYPLEHPVMQAGLLGLDTFIVQGEGMRWVEACQSPVWDTMLALQALADAGVADDDPALHKAAEWLLDRQITDVRGDWAIRRPDLQPGGWSFEYANVNYPDIDDTAVGALALREVDHPDPDRVATALASAADWVIGMQSRNGGWGAFDADNCRSIVGELPFCDFGEVIDPPSADVTAHAVEMLLRESGADARASAQAGVAWLLEHQEADGSWFGRWGVNHVYGTWSVLCALRAAGMDRSDPRIAAAVTWLLKHQNPDGGWGEDCRSYVDPAWIGRGESTASQTAWALMALHAAGAQDLDAVWRGVDWLCTTQREDGGWDEPQFTGTGFPGDFYINYHLYRVVFPVMALGRLLGEDAPR